MQQQFCYERRENKHKTFYYNQHQFKSFLNRVFLMKSKEFNSWNIKNLWLFKLTQCPFLLLKCLVKFK